MAQINYTNPSVNPCDNCPPNYVFNVNTGECELNETASAVYSGNTLTILKSPAFTNYSIEGSLLLKTISNNLSSPDYRPLPVVGTGTNQNNWVLLDNASNPILTEFGTNNQQNAGGNITNELWGTSNSSCQNTANGGGKLNQTGVWPDGVGNNIEWSIQVCVTVEENYDTIIGVGVDDNVKIYIDGALWFDLQRPNKPTINPYLTWYLFPVDLSLGTHTIEFRAKSIGGSRSLGAEIYKININDFINNFFAPDVANACGSIPPMLEPYIEFTTTSLIGNEIADPSTTGTWQCEEDPTGFFNLNFWEGTPNCIRTLTQAPEACCYRVKDCDGEEEYVIKIFTECASEVYTLLPGQVWSFELKETCGAPPLIEEKCYEIVAFENPCSQSADVCSYCPVKQRVTCDDCERCYNCENCDNPEEEIYFKWAAPPETPLDTAQTHIFNYDNTKCWNCEEIEYNCPPPAVLNFELSECSGVSFNITDILAELVVNSGNYTYEFYIDPQHSAPFTGDLNNYLPTTYPAGYSGPVQDLYVLIYSVTCTTPGEAVLTLTWNDEISCTDCGSPRMGNRLIDVCDCNDLGFTTVDLTPWESVITNPNHPYFNIFTYQWFYDQALTFPIGNPNQVQALPGDVFYLRACYFGCQTENCGVGSVTINSLLPSTDPQCIVECS
jgi:hypothetical protein